MKKAVISLVILLLFAGAIFYFGWVQFEVPTGSCGVMISKTSGVHPEPIVAGKFTWCWERLLPTNTELRIFTLEPVQTTDTLSASLPSGGVYSAALPGTPDFSYSVTMRTTARIRPERLVSLVESNDLRTQADLDAVVESETRQFNAAAVEFILRNAQSQTETLSVQPLSTEQLLAGTKDASGFSNIEIISAEASNVRIPDMALYDFARKMYMQTQVALDGTGDQLDMTGTTIPPSARTTGEQLEGLVDLGEILTKYPVLLDFLKDKDINKVLESLATGRQQ